MLSILKKTEKPKYEFNFQNKIRKMDLYAKFYRNCPLTGVLREFGIDISYLPQLTVINMQQKSVDELYLLTELKRSSKINKYIKANKIVLTDTIDKLMQGIIVYYDKNIYTILGEFKNIILF